MVLKAPSLLRLCKQSAIDNLKYFGDVGQTDADLLREILPHCTSQQLMRIETCTEGRDLTPITNDLWKKCYVREFGEESMNKVITRMTERNVTFRWKQLYETKLKCKQKMQDKGVALMRQLWEKAENEKQSRQIQVCAKVPPAGKRRNFSSGGGPAGKFANVKGRLMKKARVEYATSNEAKMMTSIRTKQTLVSCSTKHSVVSQRLSRVDGAERCLGVGSSKPLRKSEQSRLVKK